MVNSARPRSRFVVARSWPRRRFKHTRTITTTKTTRASTAVARHAVNTRLELLDKKIYVFNILYMIITIIYLLSRETAMISFYLIDLFITTGINNFLSAILFLLLFFISLICSKIIFL
jgi:hypothetical protein